MDPQEERKIEHKVKKEQGVGDPENLYASVANGIPNERDNGFDFRFSFEFGGVFID